MRNLTFPLSDKLQKCWLCRHLWRLATGLPTLDLVCFAVEAAISSKIACLPLRAYYINFPMNFAKYRPIE
jgi:hypothetical protein